MRCARVALLLALVVPCGGCFHMTTVLRVLGDGVGTIEHRMVFSNAALVQLRQFAMFAGARGQNFDPLSEQQARDLATVIGEGVKYVSSQPIVTPDGQGREATYAFPDVNQLKIATQPATPGNLRVPGLSSDGGTVSFAITHESNGNAVLHIHVPEPNWVGSIGTMSASGQLVAIKTLLAGARIELAVEPVGTLVRTSSPYADGQRVTLLDVDIDEILKDETLIGRLSAAKTQDDVMEIMRHAAGLKINLDPEITIEFTPLKHHH
jgi:hypothetical protein